jgi:hypothetical protein
MPAMSDRSPQTRSLLPFASQAEDIVRSLETRVERVSDSVLLFRYTLDADLRRLRVPERRQSRPANELWKHTCFEAFVTLAEPISGYVEWNFSPSTEWAAYAFSGYREGMTRATPPSPPVIEVEHSDSRLLVQVRVNLRGLPLFENSERDSPLRLAISSVVEDDAGRISYWALQHAPARPDFHHRTGFVLEV